MNRIRWKLIKSLSAIGIWIFEIEPFGAWDEQDKKDCKKLWEYYDKANEMLNEQG